MPDGRFTLLIVDPDARWIKRTAYCVDRNGFQVDAAHDLDELEKLLDATGADFVVMGLGEPSRIHLSRLRTLIASSPQTRFIALVSNQSESYEELLRQAGFHDILSHDLPSNQLADLLQRFAQMRRLEDENHRYRNLLECRTSFESLLGGSAPMRALYKLIEQVSRADAPVLITGEAGSEFLETAQAIHQRSERAMHPLVPVECGKGKPEEVERRIFGPVGKGAYANGPSPGESAFARAGKGALLLNGIEHLGPSAQRRLLDFFRSPFFQGETSTSPLPIARVYVTAAVDLEERIKAGKFDRELYYRLNILHIRIPPLRDRREDIPMLVEHFLQSIGADGAARRNQPSPSMTSEALLQLFQYSWPGNLEELSRSIDAAAKQTRTPIIDRGHLPPAILQAAVASAPTQTREAADVDMPLRDAKRVFETEYFKNLLRSTRGNMTLASRISKVGRPYLYKKLREYDIEPDEFR